MRKLGRGVRTNRIYEVIGNKRRVISYDAPERTKVWTTVSNGMINLIPVTIKDYLDLCSK